MEMLHFCCKLCQFFSVSLKMHRMNAGRLSFASLNKDVFQMRTTVVKQGRWETHLPQHFKKKLATLKFKVVKVLCF